MGIGEGGEVRVELRNNRRVTKRIVVTRVEDDI